MAAVDGGSEMSFQAVEADDLQSLASTENQWIIVDLEEEEEEEQAEKKESEAGQPFATLMACGPVRLGNELLAEVQGFAGLDLLELCQPVLENFPAVTSACCMGRVAVLQAAQEGHCLPAITSVIVQNSGQEAWPDGTSLRIVAGDPYGFDAMPVGALPPGHAAELTLDLALHVPSGSGCRSCWVLVDSHGEPFGPLLCLEVTR